MNDERIESKLAVIKKVIFIVWVILSLVSILFKAFTTRQIPTFSQGLADYVVFIASFVVLIIYLIINFTNEMIDERINKTIQKLFSVAFKIVIILAISAYIYQIITLKNYIVGVFPVNSFINSFFTITFIVYYLYARKQSIYFNYRLIENDKKTYFRGILKNALRIILIGASIYLIVYLTDLLNLYEINALVVTVSIGISVVLIIFEYLILSAFEYNHFSELLNHEQGRTILLSKNYIVLLIYTSVFSLIYFLFNQHYFYVMVSIIHYPYAYINKLEVIGKLLVFAEFDQFLFRIIMIAIFYHSLKKSLPHLLKPLKIIVLLQVLFMFYSFLNLVHMNLILQFIVRILNSSGFDKYMTIVNSINMVVQFMSLIIPFLLYRYFSKDNYRFAKLFLFLLGTNLLYALLPLLIHRIYYSSLFRVVSVILTISSIIISLKIYYDATKVYIEKKPENPELLA